MRIRFLTLAAGFSVLLPLAASAADQATTTPPPAASEPDASATASPTAPATAAQADPVVCHYFYWQGSLIRRPDCRTVSQWHRERLAQQRWFREFQLRSLTFNGP